MSDKEDKNPIKWFFHASLMVLFGIVALSLAIDLLTQIWPWLVGIGVLVGAITAGVAIWRSRREPW